MGEEGGREVLRPRQVAFAAPSLGRSGPRHGGARPSQVSAGDFSSFVFWGRGKFGISGRSGLETSTARPGSPHLLHLPPRQLGGPSVSGGRRWIPEGQLALLGAASPCGSRSLWARAARTRVL